ncbi:hypothetical protein [Bythopirellula polymerisocia]|uniref:Uncharacterized protein n=1 Tax=Bythopirellula polymerisocia TaxID=2528003 RepID=A0A5C6CSX8_9BACT|nr:hypothetical protein [Bythopirellula polymerisocia]TWU27498.1 hypothetical protein Pla144_22720 [Bythopirellula polymerisocia]
MTRLLNRRDQLKLTASALSVFGLWPEIPIAWSGEPILPGQAVVRQPTIDLQFNDHQGLAQWWLPELLLLGNTDVQVATQGPADWKRVDGEWSYNRVTPDGRLSVKVTVQQIQLGWMATLTICNRSDTTWSNVVAPVCLLLHASGVFQDPQWTRTFYRSNGKFITYAGCETDGGRDLFRMTLVKGQKMLERSDDHREKWGFTKRLSDDGIIAVVSSDGSAVLTTTWNPSHHLQANRRRTYSCIHANPYFGTLAPGESRTSHGYVFLINGDLEHAWSETKRVVRETSANQSKTSER